MVQTVVLHHASVQLTAIAHPAIATLRQGGSVPDLVSLIKAHHVPATPGNASQGDLRAQQGLWTRG
jgi:hypothetical protein